MPHGEYKCKACGHEFGHMPGVAERMVSCPRCGSGSTERSPYLLGTPSADGLVPEDYFDVALAPCCNIGFQGWHRVAGAACPSPDAGEDSEKGQEGKQEKGGG